MHYTWQQGDATFREVMQECCELVIDVRAEASKARGRTYCRCLISRVRGGKRSPRSGRCSKRTEVGITLCAHRGRKSESG
jgi:hypothetical protein